MGSRPKSTYIYCITYKLYNIYKSSNGERSHSKLYYNRGSNVWFSRHHDRLTGTCPDCCVHTSKFRSASISLYYVLLLLSLHITSALSYSQIAAPSHPPQMSASVHNSCAANLSTGWMNVHSPFIISLIPCPRRCFYIILQSTWQVMFLPFLSLFLLPPFFLFSPPSVHISPLLSRLRSAPLGPARLRPF